MSSAYPTSPFEHRDAVLGISFPLATIDFFPEVCGKPSPALQKLRPILKRLHDSLKVDRLSAGESRAIKAACDGAADNGAIYDTTEPKDEQLRGWRVIWFVAEYAFSDAYVLADTWREKRPELWQEAKTIIDRVTSAMYRHHPSEEEEACRIWCCHASPRKNPALEDIIWKK